MALGTSPLFECAYCRSPKHMMVRQTARGIECPSVVCMMCGLVQLEEPRRIAYESGEMWHPEGGAAKRTREDAVHEAAERMRLLKRWGVDVDGVHLLEVGSGNGDFLDAARAAGAMVTGLEPDTKRPGGVRPGVLAKYMHELAPEDGVFDVACAFHVFEHLHDPVHEIEHLWSRMAPGGRLFVEVPCVEWPYGGDLERFFWACHPLYYSRRTLEAVLATAGFRVIRSQRRRDFLVVLAERQGYLSPVRSRVDDAFTRLTSLRMAETRYRHSQRIKRAAPRLWRLLQVARWAVRDIHRDPRRLVAAIRNRRRQPGGAS